MKGTQARVMSASYQQNQKAIMSPPETAKMDSVYGPSDSLLAPLIIEVSYAIVLVRTLDWFSYSSNQPTFFSKIDL